MNQFKISICEYPITTIFVDDNVTFMSQINLNFLQRNIPCHSFSDPIKALHYINEEYLSDPFTNRCITTVSDRNTDTLESRFDFRRIHHEIYNPKRFTQIGVLTIDYAMPTMNGLDFCRQVNDEFSLRILLTGEAGPNVAITAFNEGSIDKYLQKGESELPKLLIQGIQELQHKYFLKISEAALNQVSKELYKQAPVCLSDPVFISFFNDLRQKNNIVEHYLLDEHGSFLMLDIEANPSWLVIKSEEVMENTYQYAVDQEAPVCILNYLKTRQKIPYFHTDEDLSTPFERSQKYFHSAKVLNAGLTYYYAYVKEPNLYQLDQKRILSFEEYLQKL